MNKRAVTIGPVFLVLSAGIVQALQVKQKDYPHLPDPTQIEVDMNILNDEGGVPAVLAINEKDSHTLFIYTPSYMLELWETDAKNGYRIERIDLVNVQMYDQLAQGTLSLYTTRWHLCTQEKEILNSQSSHWQLLVEEWQFLQEQVQQIRSLATHHSSSLSAPFTLPSHHERYLDLAASLIEIPHQLANVTDDHSISAQHAAIALLREGKAANPHLLSLLVDHHYQPYEVTTDPLPSDIVGPRPLVPVNEEVVRKGLSVPDLLLIHAASGVDRVQAIAALIRACSAMRQRVLLTAHSQQTLQDLLAQLPEELSIVHLQSSDLSGNNISSHSVQALAQPILQQLLEKTEATLPHLTRLAVSKNTIDQWVERLQRHIMLLSSAESVQQLPALRQRMLSIEQFISAPFLPVLAEIATAVQQLEGNLAHQKQRLNTVTERHAAAEELRQKPAIGRLLNSVEHLGQSWLKRQQALLDGQQAEYDARKQAYQQAQETMQQVIREDPEYAWCQQRIQEIESERATALAEATKAASILQETLRELVPEQPLLESPNELMLQHYLNWYTVTRTLLEQRYALLQEWRMYLSKHAERLYPELLRYADVVSGTCSAIAATKELEQVEFDLVIVDDAACMLLPDLLPSLVRARRAVLVGDPQQEPPFDEQAVLSWLQKRSSEEQLDEEQTQQITTHLTHSVFAQLWSSLDDPANSTHTVLLTTHDESQSQVQTDGLTV